jgi:DNA-directed RNA polymerase subunit RPC12/RpoP
MCRYSITLYKPHYACFNCHKTFKRRLFRDIKIGNSGFEAKCPQCGELMADMGLDFKSPKKDDLKKWEHLKNLYTVGITFHSCGCIGPAYIPNSKEKLIEYFEDMKESYFENLDYWRNCEGSPTKKEKKRDANDNGNTSGKVSNYEKEAIPNQERLDYWHEKIKKIEEKLSLIK